MPISKELISSPIEAGPSLLNSQKLPAQVTEALNYVSHRLIRKQLHLTLIIARQESQPISQPSSPQMSPPPTLNFFQRALSPAIPGSPRSPKSPKSPRSFASSTASTPQPVTPPPTVFGLDAPSEASNPYNLTLLHASTLSPKATRQLHDTVEKAARRYALGSGWLSTPKSPTSSCMPHTPSPSSDLIRRSLQQNEVVFSNEGLTLLSLDRVYSFKRAVSIYSKTLLASPSTTPQTCQEQRQKENATLTSAVDELRLLIITQNGRRITKSYLLRAYDHLAVSNLALIAVNKAYVSCFLGQAPICGLEGEKDGKIDISGCTVTDKTVTMNNVTQKIDRGPHRRGPVTPNGWDDVTPITRGEWVHLTSGRRVFGAVETC